MSKSPIQQPRFLHGKTVVITGASSGVGKAAALAFASSGATVVVAARRATALDELVKACSELGAPAHAVVLDVTEPDAMQVLAASAADFGHGTIDIWVNNAGVLAAGPFDETPQEVNDQVMHTNLLAYMHGAQAVLPYFKRQGYGTLINNISIGGFVSLPYAGAYSASKAGVQGFTAALRAELRPWKNIHICDLFPAFLDTPGIGHAANYTGAELKLSKAFLFDPLVVASAMLDLAKRPKARTYPDFAAPAIKTVYQLFPELTGYVAERVMRSYFRRASPMPFTSGNVLQTVSSGTSIHGGDPAPINASVLGKALLLVGAALTGYSLLKKR